MRGKGRRHYLCELGVDGAIAIDGRGLDNSRIRTGGREVIGRVGGPGGIH